MLLYLTVSVHDDKEFVPLNHSPGESCTDEDHIEIQMDDLEEGDGDGPHLHPEQLRKGSQLPVINKEMLKNLNRSVSIDLTENCNKCFCIIIGNDSK